MAPPKRLVWLKEKDYQIPPNKRKREIEKGGTLIFLSFHRSYRCFAQGIERLCRRPGASLVSFWGPGPPRNPAYHAYPIYHVFLFSRDVCMVQNISLNNPSVSTGEVLHS